MLKIFYRAWPDWSGVNLWNWHNAAVDKSFSACSPTQPNIWIEGDWEWAWTSCLWSRGKHRRLCSSCHRPKGCSSKSGLDDLLIVDVLLAFQFTICSSATSDALLNRPLLLSTAPAVWESLDYTVHASCPWPWQRGCHIQINGIVTSRIQIHIWDAKIELIEIFQTRI